MKLSSFGVAAVVAVALCLHEGVVLGDAPRSDCCLVHTQRHAVARFCSLDIDVLTCGYEMTECSTWNKFGTSRSHAYLPAPLQTMMSKNKKCSRAYLAFKCSEQCGTCDPQKRYLGACSSQYEEMVGACAEFIDNPVYGKYFVGGNETYPDEGSGDCVAVKGHRMMNTFSWGSLGVVVAFIVIVVVMAVADKLVLAPMYAAKESNGKKFVYKP